MLCAHYRYIIEKTNLTWIICTHLQFNVYHGKTKGWGFFSFVWQTKSWISIALKNPQYRILFKAWAWAFLSPCDQFVWYLYFLSKGIIKHIGKRFRNICLQFPPSYSWREAHPGNLESWFLVHEKEKDPINNATTFYLQHPTPAHALRSYQWCSPLSLSVTVLQQHCTTSNGTHHDRVKWS